MTENKQLLELEQLVAEQVIAASRLAVPQLIAGVRRLRRENERLRRESARLRQHPEQRTDGGVGLPGESLCGD